MCELVVAKTNAYLGQGSIRKIQGGVTILCADHPVVQQSPHLFHPLTVAHHCGVETATAAPGEVRMTTRRRAKKPAEQPTNDDE